MDAACVSILEKLLVEDAIFAEVLPEIQEDAFSLLLQVDLVATDSVGSVVDCKRYHLAPLLHCPRQFPRCR